MNFDDLFPDKRDEGETRIRQCQLVMLRMLKVFDHLCSKFQIDYFLTGGSLLGAIRHKGFIPWDDDLDIAMTRKNYEKFIRFAVPELPYDIFFQNPDTDPSYPACHLVEAKLRDKYSSYLRAFPDTPKTWHDGIQIDLFIYDKAYFPNNFLIRALNRFLIIWKHKGNGRRARVLKFIERYVPFPFVYASSYMCNKDLQKLGTYVKEKEISPLMRTLFEDMEVLVPSGWHTYLKRQYGDYMQLPPLEAQKGHYGDLLPDPFTPCGHIQSLNWKDRKQYFDTLGRKKENV